MIYGNARITAVDPEAAASSTTSTPATSGSFPAASRTPSRASAPTAANSSSSSTRATSTSSRHFPPHRLVRHTPKEVLAKNFEVPESTFDNVPKKEALHLRRGSPRPLAEEQTRQPQAPARSTTIRLPEPAPCSPPKITRRRRSPHHRQKEFPGTNIAAAIVRLKPGGLREIHWHPLADEWQYYVSGQRPHDRLRGRRQGPHLRLQEGDVGYIDISRPHYIENTGTEDLVFLEVFPSIPTRISPPPSGSPTPLCASSTNTSRPARSLLRGSPRLNRYYAAVGNYGDT